MPITNAAQMSCVSLSPEAGPGIYVLRNPSFDHLVKVGMSSTGLHSRVSSLINSTAVPFPFDVVELFPTPSKAIAKATEREVFRRLADRRASDREFFHALPGEETEALLELIESVIDEVADQLGEHEDEQDRPIPNMPGKTVEQMVDEGIDAQTKINGGRVVGRYTKDESIARAEVLQRLGVSAVAGTLSADIAAQAVGFKSRTEFHRARRIVAAARANPATFQPLLDEMNRTGRINRAHSRLQAMERRSLN